MRARMPSNRRGFITGLLLVFMPPVGLICLLILLRDRRAALRERAALRARGEATESVSEMVRAIDIAPRTPREPRRPRESEEWTQMEDYVG